MEVHHHIKHVDEPVMAYLFYHLGRRITSGQNMLVTEYRGEYVHSALIPTSRRQLMICTLRQVYGWQVSMLYQLTVLHNVISLMVMKASTI